MIEIQETDPAMIANNLTPAYPTHPGTVLKEEIEYRKLSQRKLARQMGISYKMLNSEGSGAANAVYHYDPSRENGRTERPQAFRSAEI